MLRKLGLCLLTGFMVVHWGLTKDAIAASLQYTASQIGGFSMRAQGKYMFETQTESMIYQIDEAGKVSLKIRSVMPSPNAVYEGSGICYDGNSAHTWDAWFISTGTCEYVDRHQPIDTNSLGQSIVNFDVPNLHNQNLPPNAYFVDPEHSFFPQLIGTGAATDLNNTGLVTFNSWELTNANRVSSLPLSEAYLWDSHTDDFTLIGNGQAFGVNDRGQVVGDFGLWEAGVFHTIDIVNRDQFKSPFNLTLQIFQFRAINNAGQIVALGQASPFLDIYLLNPVKTDVTDEPIAEPGGESAPIPEPSSAIALLGAAFWAIQGIKRHE